MKPRSCWEMQKDDLVEKNSRASNLIEELINGTLKSYRNKLGEIIKEENDEGFLDAASQNPVLWLEEMIEKKNWAQKEKSLLETLVDDRSFQARKELSQLKQFFDKRLFKELAPMFLKWFIKDAVKKMDFYEKKKKSREKYISRKYFGNKFFDKEIPLEDLIVKAKVMEDYLDLHYSLYSTIESLFSPISGVRFGLQTVNQFKNYISQSGSSSKEMVKLWDRKDYKKIRAFLERQKGKIDDYIHYLDWCHEKGIVKADGIKTLIEKIKKMSPRK